MLLIGMLCELQITTASLGDRLKILWVLLDPGRQKQQSQDAQIFQDVSEFTKLKCLYLKISSLLWLQLRNC